MHDGCEWCPEEDRSAYETDTHYRSTPAEFLVGADGQWRLCSGCVNLPKFKRFRVIRPVRKKGK